MLSIDRKRSEKYATAPSRCCSKSWEKKLQNFRADSGDANERVPLLLALPGEADHIMLKCVWLRMMRAECFGGRGKSKVF